MKCTERTRRVSKCINNFGKVHTKFAIRELSRYRAKEYCKDKSRYNRVLIIIRDILFASVSRIHSSCVLHARFLLHHFSSIIRRLAVSSARPLCIGHISRKCMRRVAIFLCPFQRYLFKQKLSACLTNVDTAQPSKSLWRSQLLLAAEAEAGGR